MKKSELKQLIKEVISELRMTSTQNDVQRGLAVKLPGDESYSAVNVTYDVVPNSDHRGSYNDYKITHAEYDQSEVDKQGQTIDIKNPDVEAAIIFALEDDNPSIWESRVSDKHADIQTKLNKTKEQLVALIEKKKKLEASINDTEFSKKYDSSKRSKIASAITSINKQISNLRSTAKGLDASKK
jgi:hypothetical protein